MCLNRNFIVLVQKIDSYLTISLGARDFYAVVGDWVLRAQPESSIIA